MPRNGSGSYTPPSSSWNPASNSNSATAADWNTLLADLAAAITGSVAADGQTPMTGNLQMGNNKTTGLAAATGLGDGLRLENIIAGADIASASTVTIPLEGNFFKITGTTGITGFASTRGGRSVWVTFSGILTLTNSASFVMYGGTNVTTAAGDVACFLYDGTVWSCILYKSANAAPAFSVYQSASQPITGTTITGIQFQTKEYDTNGCFNTGSYRFTPNVAGYYQFNAAAAVVSTPTLVQVSIAKNSSVYKTGGQSDGSSSGSVSSLVYMNGTTDYVEAWVYLGLGQYLTAAIASTYFNGALVRAA